MTTTVEVQIPDLLDHQLPVAAHPARFKVLRKGRRWGKDRLAFHVTWLGHGADHQWRGVLDGLDVVWLAPDFPQAKQIWQEEIEPRFRGVPGINLNASEHTVTLSGLGTLYLKSSENVDSIRGLGKRLAGVIVNEAAHLDFAYAWRRCIRPALMDNHGWLIAMSTTNSGTDGGLDDQGNRRVPSFFNTICEEIRSGIRGEEWAEFEGTAEENPEIDPAEFKALVAEYAVDSTVLMEEVYAKLLAPGTGLAFPEWSDAAHVIPTFSLPDHWEYGAGYDWGYWQPSAFVLTATGEESQTVALQELKWVQKGGYEMGQDMGRLAASLPRPLRAIAADSSIWGVKADRGFPNQAEEIQAGINDGWKQAGKPDGEAPWLAAVPKSGESRKMRVGLLHKYLRVPETHPPRLQFLKGCTQSITSIPKLPPDAKNPEDVDTQSDDHFYDALTYFLMSRPPFVETPAVPLPKDVHPGLEARYKAKLHAMGLLREKPLTEHSRYKPKGPMTRL